MEEEIIYILHCEWTTDYTNGFYTLLYKDKIKAVADMIKRCADYITEMVDKNENDWEIELGEKGCSIRKKDEYDRYHSDWTISIQKVI